MTFEVGPDDDHPEIQTDGMVDEGLRFRAECRLAGKLYGRRFGVDVAFGDPMLGEPEVVVAEDVLAFAGIAPPTLRLDPIETHIAEKLHAYTLPRQRPNTRVKDLPDLALLATARPIDGRRVARGELKRPYFPDPDREMLERRGHEHEQRYLETLRARFPGVSAGLRRRAESAPSGTTTVTLTLISSS